MRRERTNQVKKGHGHNKKTRLAVPLIVVGFLLFVSISVFLSSHKMVTEQQPLPSINIQSIEPQSPFEAFESEEAEESGSSTAEE
ncbi:MAG: hypothetical protein IKT07_10295, partial [Oscillospiraceae bacterium]|nr:hypothetical protein [Oscillospiraceae bacterium]